MQIIFTSVFGENVNYFSELRCFRSRCTIEKTETQLSTSNNDSFDHGSIIEDGRGNTKDGDVEEVVEYDDGVRARLHSASFRAARNVWLEAE